MSGAGDVVTEVRLNITWYGRCGGCGCTSAMTGYRADDTPEARAKLGTDATTVISCMVCDADVTLRCVGICIDPFVAREDDPDDEEDDDALDA